MQLRLPFSIAAVLCIALIAPGRASAQTGEAGDAQTAPEQVEAQQHFVVATTFFEQSRYDEAAREFAEAHRLSGRSELLLNVALAYEYALRYDEAITALERYLGEAPANARHRTTASERVVRLRRLRDSERTRVQREAEAIARERARHGSGNTAPTGTRSASQSEGHRGLTTMQIGGIAVLSAGAAAGVASLVTGLMASSKQDELEDACPDGVCPPDRADDIDDGESLAAVSTVLTGVAIAAAIGGTVLLVLGDEPEPSERGPVSAGLTVSPDGGNATVRVLF